MALDSVDSGPDAALTAMAGVVVAVVAAALAGTIYAASPLEVALGSTVGALPVLLSAVALLRRRPRTSTIADRVTLVRAVLASGCTALTAMVLADAIPARTWFLMALVVPTLLLDAADGHVARRTGTITVAGARLDMEVDAGFLVVLSFAVASALGAWVLLIGAMRYALLAASRLRPPLRGSLPPSWFRRTVAGLQGAMLAVALAPVVPLEVARIGVLAALVLLLVSFGTQVVMLERQAKALRTRSSVE